ncbi:ribosomal protein L1p/L10e family-domain-containing protein, partial [Mycena olivaceomarginata]
MPLIDGKVDKNQAKKAIDALHAHTTKAQQKQQDTQLLPGKEQHVWLNVTVKKIASAHKLSLLKCASYRVCRPTDSDQTNCPSHVDPRTSAVCLITKDPQRQYKDLLAEQNIKFISRVVGIEKLKGKFKPFEARRMLKENGLFLADERIVPLLPKLLGVKWFEAKKQPIPVCLTRKDLKGELERAISSTYMNQNQGTCTAIKLATTSHTPAQVLDNLALALPAIIAAIKGGWDNERWDGLVAEESDASDAEMEGVEADDEKEGKKGKKRGGGGGAQDGEKGKGREWQGRGGDAGGPCVRDENKKKRKAADAEVVVVPPTPHARGGEKSKRESFEATPAEKKAKGKASRRRQRGKASATPAEKKAKGKASVPSTPAERRHPRRRKRAQRRTRRTQRRRLQTHRKSRPGKGLGYPEKVQEGRRAPAVRRAEKVQEGRQAASATKRTEPPAPSLSNDELKQKRIGKAGEGRRKVVKGILKGGSGGKSAKDGVIGRKKAKFSQ